MTELTDHELLLEIYDDVKDLLKSDTLFRKVLFGNGDTGLSAKHESLAVEVKSIITSISARDKIAYGISGAIGLLILGLLWSIFTGQVAISFMR
mgnify:CR=1 FL=1